MTICAISTPPGIGGIAVIRVSGPDAITLTDQLFSGRHPLTDSKTHTLHYGELIHQGELLDQVVVSIYRAPHSFTGEDVVEISCHGSRYVQDSILRALIESGASLAKPGEFTQRAFLNGRLDLAEAEAVADLIAAQSRAEKELALSQLKGGVSTQLHELREQLLTLTSLLELELDFADHEELEFADRTELNALIQTILTHTQILINSFQTGNAIRNGIPVAILGATNAGKSTLLNALVGEERAIVSDIQGTTRDTIEDTLYIDGIQFRLIDTAGLRHSDDPIEKIGIERSLQAAHRAQIIIYLQDALLVPEPVEGSSFDFRLSTFDSQLPTFDSTKLIHVINKADLLDSASPRQDGYIYISAKTGDIEPLRKALVSKANLQPAEGTIISNARHYEALCRANESLHRVEDGLLQGLSGEWLSRDLQDALNALGEITGQITNDEVLGNIFSKFCIGK